MTIRNHIDALMARFGYVRAPAKSAATSTLLKIEVDTTQVSEALPAIERLAAAALEAEAALARLRNIQAAMRNCSPSTGSGGATGCGAPSRSSVVADSLESVVQGIKRDKQVRAHSG